MDTIIKLTGASLNLPRAIQIWVVLVKATTLFKKKQINALLFQTCWIKTLVCSELTLVNDVNDRFNYSRELEQAD